jgi:hypothetical protein
LQYFPLQHGYQFYHVCAEINIVPKISRCIPPCAVRDCSLLLLY